MSDLLGERAMQLAGAAALLLGWRPDEFWSATPAELSAALGAEFNGGGGADRDTLADLIRRFPDE